MTYGINTSKILNVAGTFEVIGEHDNILYVKGEELQEPFFVTELPQVLQEKIERELKEARVQKERELNAICDLELVRFESSALGSAHFYDASLEDQVNLIALAFGNQDGYFRAYKENEPKQNIPHTKEQLKQVFNDGMSHKASAIYKCGVLKNHLLKLTSKEDINNLGWEDYERIANLQED